MYMYLNCHLEGICGYLPTTSQRRAPEPSLIPLRVCAILLLPVALNNPLRTASHSGAVNPNKLIIKLMKTPRLGGRNIIRSVKAIKKTMILVNLLLLLWFLSVSRYMVLTMVLFGIALRFVLGSGFRERDSKLWKD